MFVFSHIFSLLREFTFPMFWELYGFTGKISPDLGVGKIWLLLVPIYFPWTVTVTKPYLITKWSLEGIKRRNWPKTGLQFHI